VNLTARIIQEKHKWAVAVRNVRDGFNLEIPRG
jgi:hypothetical protein